MRRSLAVLLSAALTTPSVWACSGPVLGGGGGASWCRLDDPAFVERERKKLKLGRDEVAKVACPTPSPAAQKPEELALPMPCGRRMVFRKVSVQLADALDFESAAFGDADATDAFRKAVTGPWKGEVAGTFSEKPDGSGASYYYIGKYEVTAPQWAAFADPALKPGSDPGESSGACKAERAAASKVEGAQVLPAVKIAWADAMAFADRYSRWLIAYESKHGGLGQVTPNNEARPGFVRLPTESEWEFAARGGDSQSSGRGYAVHPDFGGSASPDLSDIAWFHGVGQEPPRGASVYYVGRKSPNRLMLFDIVGNAEELTYDLFRPVRPDGLVAGRPGGAVARGGGAEDGPDLVGVGVRREVELYDRDGAVGGPTTGLRLVVAAPFFANRAGAGAGEMQGNPAFRDGLTSAWGRLEKGEGAPGAEQRNDSLAQLQQLRTGAPTAPDALKKKLDAIQSQLQTASAAVAAKDQAAVEEQFLTAILAAGYAREETMKLRNEREALAPQRAQAAASPQIARAIQDLDRKIAAEEAELHSAFDYYARIVTELAQRPPDQLDRIEAAVSDRLQRGGSERLRRWAPVARRHIRESRTGPPSSQTLQRWISELTANFAAARA